MIGSDNSAERRAEAEAGFTLLEAVIAIVLMTAIFGAAFGVVVQGSQTVETELSEGRLRKKVQQILERAVADLRSARVEPILSPYDLRFRKLKGSYEDGFADFDFATAEISWDGVPLSQYTWVLVADEVLNDADDNGDGRSDEGVLLRNHDGASVVVARNVPRNGFSVRRLGTNKIEISLTLEEVRGEGDLLRATDTTTVFLRN